MAATATELNLKPLASCCFASGGAFAPGDRVVSFLVRPAAAPETLERFDVREDRAAGFAPDGAVACRWVQVYRERPREDGARVLRLTAENLFLTLADPPDGPAPENGRLLRFLAILLERKRVLRPRGPSGGGGELYEHVRTKQVYAVPAEELTPEFFLSLQGQMGALGLG